MNSFQVQVLDFTQGFPPAYALTKSLMNVNYRKHFNTIMNSIETIVVFLIALGIVFRQKWMQYDCTERLQLAALTVKDYAVNSYFWMKGVGVPNLQNAIGATYVAGMKVREIYNTFSSPLFIDL